MWPGRRRSPSHGPRAKAQAFAGFPTVRVSRRAVRTLANGVRPRKGAQPHTPIVSSTPFDVISPAVFAPGANAALWPASCAPISDGVFGTGSCHCA